MRVKNTIINMKIGMIFTIVTLILNFIGRSFFVRILGVDIAGFNTLISNLMGFLNIAELGIVSAITYSLYKPLKDSDYNKINDIMKLFAYFYRNVAKFILIGGIILSFGLNIFVKGQVPIREAYIYYFLFLFNTVIAYFFIYKQTLMIADQKQYVVIIFTNTMKIIKTIVQIIVINITLSYFMWIILEIIFNIFNLVIINMRIKKIYPKIWLKNEKSVLEIKGENEFILKNIKDVFFHKIAGFIAFQTDGILISIFLKLEQTAIYGNYMMVINGILAICNSIMGSFTASIGNLVAEEDNSKNFNIFKKLYTVDHFIAIILTYSVYSIINDFMILWIGKNYTFDKKVITIIAINLYIQVIRGTIDKFKETYGIFWDKFAPIIEGSINLIISIVLINIMGIVGLFIGTLISNIVIILIWKPYVVYKYGFKKNPKEHITLCLKALLRAGIIVVVVQCIMPNMVNIINIESVLLNFLVKSVVKCGIIVSVTFFVFMTNKEFKNVFKIVFMRKK